MTVKVYIAADTAGSGFGVASNGIIRELLENDKFKVTLRTHNYGWNDDGMNGEDNISSQRLKHFIKSNGYVNEDYIHETVREAVDSKKEDEGLIGNLGRNEEIEPSKCMVRQFEGKEDIWLAIGDVNFAEQAPEEDEITSILSTDFNLDRVPREWEYFLEKIDEVWVPSKWTYESITKRFGETSKISEKTYWFHYGINQEYKPTTYDCSVCPQQHAVNQNFDPNNQPCLKDDKFTFIVVSRFHHIKGVYRTVKAFAEEFKDDEPVRMFLKTTSNNHFQFSPSDAVQKMINETGYPDLPEIGVSKDHLSKQQLYDLMGVGDAFVQASRAECFGIAQLEAAYCGTPVIYTDWSSQAEVMDETVEGMYPLKDFSVERNEPETQLLGFNDSYDADSKWAVPDKDSLGDLMREVYEKKDEKLEEEGEKCRMYVEENFDWSENIKPRVQRLLKNSDSSE